MYSFYGGKQGRTYHIVQRFDCVSIENFDTDFADILIKSDDTGEEGKFKIENLTISTLVKNVTNNKYYRIIKQPTSIDDTFNSQYSIEFQLKGMVQQFNKGGNYTDVNYGQYVIIDTIKNLGQHTNDENGLLFRRGFDYLESSSTKPKKSDYYEADQTTHTNIFNENKWQEAWSSWIENVGGGAIYVGQIVGPIGKTGQLDAVKWSDLGLSEDQAIELELTRLGAERKDGQPQFQDDILFGVAQIKAANGDIKGHKISFDFVKPVVKMQAKQVLPYDTQTINFKDPISEQEVEQQISFDENGNATTDLVIEYDKQKTHPFYYSYQIAVPCGKHGNSVDSLSVKQNSNDNNYDYLTYKLKRYDNDPNGIVDSEDTFISPYNIIKDITSGQQQEREFINIPDDIKISQNNPYVTRSEAFIGSLARNTNWSNNKFLVCINLGSMENIYIPNTFENEPIAGQIYKDENNTSSAIWQCIELPSVAQEAKITIQFTADQNKTYNIRNISYLYMDQYGNIYIKYSDIEGEATKIGHIPVVKDITFSNFESGGDSKFHKTISTDNGFDQLSFAQQINYPVDIKRLGDVMCVLYSSQKYRNSIPEGQYKIFTYNNKSERYKVFPLVPDTYHILGEVKLEDLVGNGDFANGVQNYTKDGNTPYKERAGWVVSVTNEDQTQTTLYAYDYLNGTHEITIDGQEYETHWYPIETRDTGVDLNTYYIIDGQAAQSSQNNYIPIHTTESNNLKVGGIWFVLA